MKHFFHLLFVGLTFVSFGQKKSFDLKESVLKQRALSPVRLNNFQWIPESDSILTKYVPLGRSVATKDTSY